MNEKTKNSDNPFHFYSDKFKNKVHFAGQKHSSIKHIQSIIQNTKPNPQKLFVIEGIWAHELAKKHNLEIEIFMFCPEFIFSNEAEKIIEEFISLSKDSYIVSKKVFLRLSERENPDGLLAVCKLRQYTLQDLPLDKNNLFVILDGIEIPGNIGTIMRSVDGAGADGVLVCNRRARLTHPKVIKGSQGASFIIPIVEEETSKIIHWLKENNFKIYLTDTKATEEYFKPTYTGRVALVAGSEKYGISKEWYETDCHMISIPMLGECDSLNVAISTSIILYEASFRQKGLIKRTRSLF